MPPEASPFAALSPFAAPAIPTGAIPARIMSAGTRQAAAEEPLP